MTGQLERTGCRIVAGTWGCAVITMAASAANAALTYGALGDNPALGLATGVAVDIGLCVALIGDRQLYAHGLSSNWGRVLRVTTAVMSLVLNVGVSLRDGDYFAALLHSFLPVLLIVLCEYGQDVLLQLTALRRKHDAAEQAASPPVPVGEALPQLHRPLAAPPVTAAPVPTVRPIHDSHRQEYPTGTPSTAASAARSSDRTPDQPGDAEVVARVRKLLTEADGQTPGRRAVAKQLGISEHQARVALGALAAATTGPALNGHQPANPAGGRGRGGR